MALPAAPEAAGHGRIGKSAKASGRKAHRLAERAWPRRRRRGCPAARGAGPLDDVAEEVCRLERISLPLDSGCSVAMCRPLCCSASRDHPRLQLRIRAPDIPAFCIPELTLPYAWPRVPYCLPIVACPAPMLPLLRAQSGKLRGLVAILVGHLAEHAVVIFLCPEVIRC